MRGLTKKEAIIQCALGTLTYQELEEKAKESTERAFLEWAIDHPRAEIRKAAIFNKHTPITCLLARVPQELTKLKDLLVQVLRDRYPEVKEVLRERTDS